MSSPVSRRRFLRAAAAGGCSAFAGGSDGAPVIAPAGNVIAKMSPHPCERPCARGGKTTTLQLLPPPSQYTSTKIKVPRQQPTIAHCSRYE